MVDKKKPIGEVTTHTFQMRVHKSFMDEIDAWRRTQEDLPSQAEAIRRLVRLGLGVGWAAKKRRDK